MQRLLLVLAVGLGTFLGNYIYYHVVMGELLEKTMKDDNDEMEENNLVEFVGEDENGNGLYRFKN